MLKQYKHQFQCFFCGSVWEELTTIDNYGKSGECVVCGEIDIPSNKFEEVVVDRQLNNRKLV